MDGPDLIGGAQSGVKQKRMRLKHCDAILRGSLDQGLDQRLGLNRGSEIGGETL